MVADTFLHTAKPPHSINSVHPVNGRVDKAPTMQENRPSLNMCLQSEVHENKQRLGALVPGRRLETEKLIRNVCAHEAFCGG
jgi:hypothetical protein